MDAIKPTPPPKFRPSAFVVPQRYAYVIRFAPDYIAIKSASTLGALHSSVRSHLTRMMKSGQIDDNALVSVLAQATSVINGIAQRNKEAGWTHPTKRPPKYVVDSFEQIKQLIEANEGELHASKDDVGPIKPESDLGTDGEASTQPQPRKRGRRPQPIPEEMTRQQVLDRRKRANKPGAGRPKHPRPDGMSELEYQRSQYKMYRKRIRDAKKHANTSSA